MHQKNTGEDGETMVSDLGTEELKNKTIGVVTLTKENHRRRRILVQVPIDYYLERRSIDRRQWEAGDKLFRTFEAGGLMPSSVPLLTKLMSGGFLGGGGSLSDSQEEARDSYRKAIEYLGATRIGTILLVNVCCYGFMLNQIDVPYYESSNGRMSRLNESLTELADFYGLPRYPTSSRKKSKQRKNPLE